MISSGINVVMTVIGFAMSTMFIVFVCTRLVCARIQLTSSRRAFPTASRSDPGLLEHGFHGLEPLVLSSFPTRKFSHEYFSSGEDSHRKKRNFGIIEDPCFVQERTVASSCGGRIVCPLLFCCYQWCTVCLAAYQEKDILRILPYCGHAFHMTCIDIWLHQHSTCPVCRISLHDSADGKRLMQPMSSMAFRYMDYLHPYHSLYNTSHGYSPRTVGNHRMEPIQEDQFVPDHDLAESREIVSPSNHIGKNTPFQGLKSKSLESPSNS